MKPTVVFTFIMCAMCFILTISLNTARAQEDLGWYMESSCEADVFVRWTKKPLLHLNFSRSMFYFRRFTPNWTTDVGVTAETRLNKCNDTWVCRGILFSQFFIVPMQVHVRMLLHMSLFPKLFENSFHPDWLSVWETVKTATCVCRALQLKSSFHHYPRGFSFSFLSFRFLPNFLAKTMSEARGAMYTNL